MQLVPTRQAVQLTGLSGQTLREWTSRRALIPADLPPRSRGSAAKFSWQTILLLRVAVAIRDQFHLELQAHRSFFANLRMHLQDKSFIAMWSKAHIIHAGDRWQLIEASSGHGLREDGVVILLDPHLVALSEGFALPKPSSVAGQLDLFPTTSIGDSAAKLARRVAVPSAEPQRKSA